MRSDDPKIETLIQSEQFHHFPGTTITVCAVKLHCGQQTVGYSVGPANGELDHERERARAKEAVCRRIAGLESYLERVARSERVSSVADLEAEAARMRSEVLDPEAK